MQKLPTFFWLLTGLGDEPRMLAMICPVCKETVTTADGQVTCCNGLHHAPSDTTQLAVKRSSMRLR